MIPTIPLLRLITILIPIFLLVACATGPYRYKSLDEFTIKQRAVSQTQGDFTVRASAVSNQEASDLFGIDLSKRKIQAVWMEVQNQANVNARFAPYSVDSNYYPPHEVAYMYRKKLSKQGWQDMERRFFELSMQRYVQSGETVSGFVFTNAQAGTKSFNADILYLDGTLELERFIFFLDVPGFKPDHADIEFNSIYPGEEIRDVGLEDFRELVAALPCCTSNRDGNAQGQPVEVMLVARGKALLQALLRAGWSETSYQRDPSYLSAADHYFGRPPDVIFRKGRDKTTERNEMGIWLAPVRVDGVPLWVAQIKHAIGRRFEIGENFLGVRLDPHIDDGRNYLLQDMWYSQSLKAFSWSKSGLHVPMKEPALDFNENAWFSDGYRIVLWISGKPIDLASVQEIKWDAVITALERYDD